MTEPSITLVTPGKFDPDGMLLNNQFAVTIIAILVMRFGPQIFEQRDFDMIAKQRLTEGFDDAGFKLSITTPQNA
jgi:hypothetical protein